MCHQITAVPTKGLRVSDTQRFTCRQMYIPHYREEKTPTKGENAAPLTFEIQQEDFGRKFMGIKFSGRQRLSFLFTNKRDPSCFNTAPQFQSYYMNTNRPRPPLF